MGCAGSNQKSSVKGSEIAKRAHRDLLHAKRIEEERQRQEREKEKAMQKLIYDEKDALMKKARSKFLERLNSQPIISFTFNSIYFCFQTR